MSERKKNDREVRWSTVLYCAGTVCGTVLVMGAIASLAVVRGWMQMEQLRYAALVALWAAALLGGILLCVKTKGVPILCGMAVAGAEVLLCLVVGMLWIGTPTGAGVLVRVLASGIGGVLGGVLCASCHAKRRRG